VSEARDPLLAAVDMLAPAFEASGLAELELEAGELSVRLVRAPSGVPAGPSGPPPAPSSVPGMITPFGEPTPGMRFVTAPLTGIWYSAPSPDARPYVERSGQVAVGQVVGLIEAMKLFNEIKSDVAGTVARILVENGTLVKRQQPLLEIKPLG